MAISNISIIRSSPEPDGRRYITWQATLPDGSTVEHGPVLCGGEDDAALTTRMMSLIDAMLAAAEMRANLDEVIS